MANLMTFPSAAGGLSEGLQSGITLGIQMRKQREDEDHNAWQKQKFQEQQTKELYVNEINKAIGMMSSTNSTLKKMGADAYIKAQANHPNFSGMDAEDIKKARESLATIGDNVYGDIVKEGSGALDFYKKTKDFDKFQAGINGLHIQIAQQLSGPELTQAQTYIDSLKKEGITQRSQYAEKQALDALTGKPIVAGFEDTNRQIPITVTPTEEDINQTTASLLPLMEKGSGVQKTALEKMLPKTEKDFTSTEYIDTQGRPLTHQKTTGQYFDVEGNRYTGQVKKLFKPSEKDPLLAQYKEDKIRDALDNQYTNSTAKLETRWTKSKKSDSDADSYYNDSASTVRNYQRRYKRYNATWGDAFLQQYELDKKARANGHTWQDIMKYKQERGL